MNVEVSRKTVVYSNFFPVSFMTLIYKYNIEIDSSSSLSPMHFQEILRQEIIQNKENRNVISQNLGNQFIFLNGAIYTPFVLSSPLDLISHFEEKNLRIRIIQDSVVDPQKDSDVYKIIIGRFMRILLKKLRLKQIGKKIFDPSSSQNMDMFEIWPGFSTNIAFNANKCMLNIDLASKIITNSNVLVFMEKLRERSSHDMEAVLRKELVGKSIMTTYNRRFYRVDRIAFELNPTTLITLHDNTQITFIDYYMNKYEKKIFVLDQPLLASMDHKAGKEVFLVPEMCVLTGLSEEQRSNRNLMTELDKIIKPEPGVRLQRSKGLIDAIKQNENTKAFMDEWKLAINSQPVQVEGARLEAGSMLLGDQRSVDIEHCQNLDRDSQGRFYQSKNFKTLMIFYPRMCCNEFNTFQDLTKTIFDQMKITCESFVPIEISDFRNFEQIKQAAMANLTPQVTACIWILPGNKKNGQHYDSIKRLLINTLPVPSQMILAKTIGSSRNLRSIITKMYIQVCAKIGGVPWAISELPFSQSPTMIIGLDVFSKLGGIAPVYSIVATNNNSFSTYWSNSSFGSHDFTVQQFIKLNLPRAIEKFNKDNSVLPENIIVFRNGVSSGQRDVIKSTEVAAIRESIESIFAAPLQKPSLIFITTSKQCNAKFFYSTSGSSDPKSLQNPLQGTYISQEVCSDPAEFYLIAQKTFRGLSSPTNFYILENDLTEIKKIDFRIVKDELAKLAFKLCFLYYNTVGAIKVPAPVHYAQKLTEVVQTISTEREKIIPHQFLAQISSLYFI
jgi:aubergine-like protein